MTFTFYRGNTRVTCIWNSDCRSAKNSLRMHIDNELINPQLYKSATVRVPETLSDNSDESKNYMLKFQQKYGTEELWVSGVTAGTRSESSGATVECLRMMGFQVAEELIYDLKPGILQRFRKK